MTNRRGIFSTSVIGKDLEKAVFAKVENSISTSKFQNVGRKGRSTKDNWLALMAVVDRNRELKRNIYLIFADAEKCLDKLWLVDCLVGINKDGMRETERSHVAI